ncbi:hypothetical protein DERP_000543 [Dermatophagoides pteronyssinus]|uniref:Uncharacterized protein n=1 Tax=Dermatophagoides pteronyssinus TaxID=6956 RepID=A0ABQ8J0F3_DERPT|nr:hypothetical protein DERP_000543 [Dermatophagoides pteronyssinus]
MIIIIINNFTTVKQLYSPNRIDGVLDFFVLIQIIGQKYEIILFFWLGWISFFLYFTSFGSMNKHFRIDDVDDGINGDDYIIPEL